MAKMAKKKTVKEVASQPKDEDELSPSSTSGSKPLTSIVDLKKTKKWKYIQKEFVAEELEVFEEEFQATLDQFRGNILHTEINQVIDIIRYEILKTRYLVEKKETNDEIKAFERTLDGYIKQFDTVRDMDDRQKEEMLDLQNRINIAKQREQEQTKILNNTQTQLDKLRTLTSSSRDQRISDLEDGKVDFVSIIKALQNRDVQERKSRDLQLIRMAGAKELESLGELHKYDDGNWDRPVLNHTSVMSNDEPNETSKETES